MMTAAAIAEARTTAMAATALVAIALVTLALAIGHFVTHHIVADTTAHVVAIAITFVSM
jgi:hypothetical protein